MLNSKTVFIGMAIFGLAINLTIAGSAFAKKPSWAGGGQNNEVIEQVEETGPSNQRVYKNQKKNTVGSSVSSRESSITINQYPGSQSTNNNCPPGLAKKNNGCLPPGQAKKQGW
jgi:hypothetical protein